MERFDVINSNRPFIISDRLHKWELLSYTLEQWESLFGDKKLPFRVGKRFNEVPYWEYECAREELTFQNFVDYSLQTGNDGKNKFQEKWLYYDYKYMHEVFGKSSEILKMVQWADLGFTELCGMQSSIWIGNNGAHTPCHYDTYGCNLVAQLYGHKLWLLMPPEESPVLDPVRVPYEESSVYSSYNFHAPNKILLKLKQVYKVILSPGEVLFVPRHWWHYVENLDLAISINTWIPLEIDIESHVEEFLIRQFIYNTCRDMPECNIRALLNPNEYDLLTEGVDNSLLTRLLEKCKTYREYQASNTSEKSNNNCREVTENDCKYISQWSLQEAEKYVKDKEKMFSSRSTTSSSLIKNERVAAELNLYKQIISSFCHPQVISLVKERLLQQQS